MSENNLVVYKEDPKNVIIKNPSFAEFYLNIAKEPFDEKTIKVLSGPVSLDDIEIRPDGLIYLPEIKYRRILNKAFGVGAWSMVQMNTIIDQEKSVVYYDGALFINGRYHARATGEMKYISRNENMTWATALEGAKSDCLTRCCKDLGIASELWDPTFIKKWLNENAIKIFVKNQKTNDTKVLWRRKTDPKYNVYPWLESGFVNGNKPITISRPETEIQSGNLHHLQKTIGLALIAICGNDKIRAANMLKEYLNIKSTAAIKSEQQARFLISKIRPKYEVAFNWDELEKEGKVVTNEDIIDICPEINLPFEPIK